MDDERPSPNDRRSARRLWISLALVLLGLPVLFYAVLSWRWHAEPEITFDFLAELNAPALAVPEGQRAWPMLREAWAADGITDLDLPERAEDGDGWVIRRADLAGFAAGGYGATAEPEPVEPEPVDVAAWLEEHATLVAAGRDAAGFGGLGWIASHGPIPEEEIEALHGGQDPHEGRETPRTRVDRLVAESATWLLLPTLGPLRTHGKVLMIDAHAAAEAWDGRRWLEDLAGIDALARFAAETPTLISDLVSLSLLTLHNRTVEESVLADPQRLGEAALAEMAQRLTAQRIRGVLRLEGERLAMRDLLQRTHAPGPGGRLTATGAEVLDQIYGLASSRGDGWWGRLQRLAEPVQLLNTATREENLAAYDRYLAAVFERLQQPMRDATGPEPAQVAGFDEDGFEQRHPVLATAATSFDALPKVVELGAAQRDAARLAVALARHRLAHDAWPDALGDLVPAYLDDLPADRITGGPLRFAVRGGQPVVWSVGADRDDDGGVPASNGPKAAALWGEDAASPPDGDWVLVGADE